MSVNTAHASNGVLIHAGEYILLHSDCVTMDFSGQDNSVFRNSKQGRIYLTSHRMIFNNKKPGDSLQSFSAPFIAMSNVELEQPVFGSNYIKGKVRAQPNGNFVGEVKFKLFFKAGGAIEYGQALLRAASTAQSNMRHGGLMNDDPPPYTPSGAWHEAPPPAYQPPPGYYGWLPTHDAFSGPPPNSVFISDNPPPYPGIGGPPPYSPPSAPAQTIGCQNQINSSGTPSWNGFSAPPSESSQQTPHYPPSQQGWNYSLPQYGGPGFQQPSTAGCNYDEYSSGSNSRPTFNQSAVDSAGGAMGFNAPPSNPKETEAMASAHNNPYNQRGHNPGNDDMPPAYNELQPNYYDSARKYQ